MKTASTTVPGTNRDPSPADEVLSGMDSRKGPRCDVTRPGGYRPDIDGLRGVAVLLVVGFHAFPEAMPGGFVGVDVFFVISGFLITTILREQLASGTFSIADFYGRRIRRIFPALILLLSAVYAAGWLLFSSDEFKQLGKHIAAGAGFVPNFVLWAESGYFDQSSESKPLLHLWSLGIEEQFYLAWPLLLWLAWRLGLGLPVVAMVLAIVSFTANMAVVGSDLTEAFYSPLTRAWELMLGAAVALTRIPATKGMPAACNGLLAAIGVALMLASLAMVGKEDEFPGWRALLPSLGATLLVVAGPDAWVNRRILSTRALVWIGLISYPLYLWHWPALSMMDIVLGDRAPPSARTIAILCSALLAWATYLCLEMPVRRGGKRFRNAMACLLLLLAVGCLGLDAYRRDGLPGRPVLQGSVVSPPIASQLVESEWGYWTNGNCLRRFPFEKSASYGWWFCMLSRDRPPSVLLLGNSYANQLYPGLAGNADFNHHAILSIGACDAVGHALADERRYGGKSPCTRERFAEQKEFIDGIIAATDELKLVIVAGFPEKPEAAYLVKLKERIDFLLARGVKVVVFIPHAKLDYDIRNCFARPFRPMARDCALDAGVARRIAADYGALGESAIGGDGRLLFFDENRLFCRDGTCSAIRDGIPLVRDRVNHLSGYGGEEMARMFVDWAKDNIPELLAPSPGRPHSGHQDQAGQEVPRSH